METDRRQNCYRQDANMMSSSTCQCHVKRMASNDQHRQGAGENIVQSINLLLCPFHHLHVLPTFIIQQLLSMASLFSLSFVLTISKCSTAQPSLKEKKISAVLDKIQCCKSCIVCGGISSEAQWNMTRFISKDCCYMFLLQFHH